MGSRPPARPSAPSPIPEPSTFWAYLNDLRDERNRGAIPQSQNHGHTSASHSCRRCGVWWTPLARKAPRCWVCGGTGRLRSSVDPKDPGIEGWAFL